VWGIVALSPEPAGLMSKHLTSRSNWNLEMLVFMEGGKPEYP